MSYRALYGFCQGLPLHVDRNTVMAEAVRLTGAVGVRPIRSSLDTAICRGYYLSARNHDHQLVRMAGGATVIVLARANNRCWERFVFVKELMHLFDDPLEATDSGDEFETVLNEFESPTIARSPQMESEVDCFWRAVGVRCPEEQRLRFQKDRENGRIDDLGIAEALRIPRQYIQRLFHPDYRTIMHRLVEQAA